MPPQGLGMEEDMKKAARHFSVILKGILITGFSIQIAFGAVWMCFHFGCMQEFGGSEEIGRAHV